MRIYYFGEFIADTKIETEINSKVVKARIDVLHQIYDLSDIDVNEEVYQPSMLSVQQLALI